MNFSLRKNTYSALGQVAFTGVSLFFLYKFIIQEIGLEQLGIWSLLLSISTSVGILNSGFTGSIVRYVAEYHSTNRNEDARKLIRTFFTTNFILFLSIALFILLYQNLILFFVKLSNTEGALFSALLPYTMLIFLLSTLSGVFLSSLEGFQKLYLKNMILIISAFLTLCLAYFLVPVYQLRGIAYTYIISNFFVYFLSWYFLRQNLGYSLNFLPFGWSKPIFKETFAYNAKFQVISISSILNDPLIRIIMTRYTGLQIAGVYELSSKIILQLRALIISTTQSLVPVFASLGKERKTEALDFYQKTYDLAFFIGLFSFSTLVISSPLISLFWIGDLNPTFIWFMLILSFGWMTNSLCAPAYFANNGFGSINPNLVSHILINIVSLGICITLAKFGFGYLLISGWSIALFVGSIYLIIEFKKNNNLSKVGIIPEKAISYCLISALGAIVCFSLFRVLLVSDFTKAISILVLYLLIQISYFYFSGKGYDIYNQLFKNKN